MSLKHGILGLLTYESMSGYEIMKIFNDSLSFFWNAQTSQIYRELNSIEEEGWVTCELVQQDDKPNKKIFTITKSGMDELVKWLDGHDPSKIMNYRDDMTLRVFFSGNSSRVELVKELIHYYNLNKKFFNGLKKVESETDLRAEHFKKYEDKIYWTMAIKRGQIKAQANMKWVKDCLDLLEEEYNEL